MFEHKILEQCDRLVFWLHDREIHRLWFLRYILIAFFGSSAYLFTAGVFSGAMFALFTGLLLTIQWVEEKSFEGDLKRVNARKVVSRTTWFSSFCRLAIVTIHVLAAPAYEFMEFVQAGAFIAYTYFQMTQFPTEPPAKRYGKLVPAYS